jgi:high-affinity Fe2+/Pb2+ permease
MGGMSLIVLASEATHTVNQALSWGIGALVLGILLAAVIGLLVFGAGREHS